MSRADSSGSTSEEDMNAYQELTYPEAAMLTFGRSAHPVKCGYDLTIGDGLVLPEVNFTLPAMTVSAETRTAVLAQYREMVESVLGRLATLGSPGAVIEFEHAPQMTEQVDVGRDITRQIASQMRTAFEESGLRTALRVTVCDIRDRERPPRMRTGEAARTMMESFAANAEAGADMLSIESTGGKEISDKALMEGDTTGLLVALGTLGPRDMHFLWREIVKIADAAGIVPAGDTACAFANTAMVLADRHYIPNVLAAVVRAMSAVRSLVAFEEGARGPSKDCAYEGPVLKAITGYPISMEGRSSACAHFSHVGNIASAACDLWSNESVQNVQLLSGFAPEVFTEILEYDCRLMNEAIETGADAMLRRLLVRSDINRSVHAMIIAPDAAVRIAAAIVAESSDFLRTRAAGLAACELIRSARSAGELVLPTREMSWLDRIEAALESATDEDDALAEVLGRYGGSILPEEYGLAAEQLSA